MKKSTHRDQEGNLQLLICKNHGKKLKYICPLEEVDLSKFLLCSKCLISESDFVQKNKKSIFELEQFFSFVSSQETSYKNASTLSGEYNGLYEDTNKLKSEIFRRKQFDLNLIQRDINELFSYIKSQLDDHKRRLTDSVTKLYTQCYDNTDNLMKNMRTSMQDIEKIKQTFKQILNEQKFQSQEQLIQILRDLALNKVKKTFLQKQTNVEQNEKIRNVFKQINQYKLIQAEEEFFSSVKSIIERQVSELFEIILNFQNKDQSQQQYSKKLTMDSPKSKSNQESRQYTENEQYQSLNEQQQSSTQSRQSIGLFLKQTNKVIKQALIQRIQSVGGSMSPLKEVNLNKSQINNSNNNSNKYNKYNSIPVKSKSPKPQRRMSTTNSQTIIKQKTIKRSLSPHKKTQRLSPSSSKIDTKIQIKNTLGNLKQPKHDKIIETDQEDGILSSVLVQDVILATSGADATIKLWDIRTFQGIATLLGHQGAVRCLLYYAGRNNTNEDYLLSGSDDKSILIWDISNISSIKLTAQFQGHTHSIMSLSQIWNSTCIVSCSRDQTICIWNMNGFEAETKFIKGHKSAVHCLCSLSSRNFISGGQDRQIILWQVKFDQFERTITGCDQYKVIQNAHENGVTQLAVSKQDEDLLISAGKDNTIKIWCLSQKKCLRRLTGHKDFVLSLLILERPLSEDELNSRKYQILHSDEKKLMKDLGIISIGKDKLMKFWTLLDSEKTIFTQQIQHEFKLHVAYNALSLTVYKEDDSIKVITTSDGNGVINVYTLKNS